MTGKTIVVTSGKGGVGKTTTAANIGASLALRGRRVVLIDANCGLRNLDIVLGLEDRVLHDLADVLEGRCPAEQAMVHYAAAGELYLIPAPEGHLIPVARSSGMQELCGRLKQQFDYVIVDSPNGLESGFKLALAPADEALLVATPEVSAVSNVDRIIGLVRGAGVNPIGFVLNRLRYHLLRRGDMLSVEDITQVLNVPLLGVVPEKDEVVVAANRGTPLVCRSRSTCGEAFRRIAARLDGEEAPIAEPEPRGLLTRAYRRARLAPAARQPTPST